MENIIALKQKMKILIVLICVTIFSCQPEITKVEPETTQYKLDNFCDTFLANHKNWYQNDITIKQANQDFKISLANDISKGVLSDFPLALNSIYEYQSGKYTAHFSNGYRIKTKHKFNFDLITFIEKAEGEKLKTDSIYNVSGDFKSFLTIDNYMEYTNRRAYSNLIKIEKGMFDTSANFFIGIMLFDKPVIKRMTGYEID